MTERGLQSKPRLEELQDYTNTCGGTWLNKHISMTSLAQAVRSS